MGTETELSRGKVIEVLAAKIRKLRSEQLVPSSQGRHALWRHNGVEQNLIVQHNENAHSLYFPSKEAAISMTVQSYFYWTLNGNLLL